eukprot:m.40951 g.40951  ORF g.40951 m.40951 type:complete len:431 (+) comp10414_c0_seq1:848-2140(+)
MVSLRAATSHARATSALPIFDSFDPKMLTARAQRWMEPTSLTLAMSPALSLTDTLKSGHERVLPAEHAAFFLKLLTTWQARTLPPSAESPKARWILHPLQPQQLPVLALKTLALKTLQTMRRQSQWSRAAAPATATLAMRMAWTRMAMSREKATFKARAKAKAKARVRARVSAEARPRIKAKFKETVLPWMTPAMPSVAMNRKTKKSAHTTGAQSKAKMREQVWLRPALSQPMSPRTSLSHLFQAPLPLTPPLLLTSTRTVSNPSTQLALLLSLRHLHTLARNCMRSPVMPWLFQPATRQSICLRFQRPSKLSLAHPLTPTLNKFRRVHYLLRHPPTQPPLFQLGQAAANLTRRHPSQHPLCPAARRARLQPPSMCATSISRRPTVIWRPGYAYFASHSTLLRFSPFSCAVRVPRVLLLSPARPRPTLLC